MKTSARYLLLLAFALVFLPGCMSDTREYVMTPPPPGPPPPHRDIVIETPLDPDGVRIAIENALALRNISVVPGTQPGTGGAPGQVLSAPGAAAGAAPSGQPSVGLRYSYRIISALTEPRVMSFSAQLVDYASGRTVLNYSVRNEMQTVNELASDLATQIYNNWR